MPAIESDGGHVRLRLDISYDGTEFAGWAPQAGQRTVAGVIEETLSTVFREPVRLVTAGRTDTGVHATGQVAHVDVPSAALSFAYPRTSRPGDAEFLPLVRRLARFLPADVRVRDIVRAAPGFDARFSALRRHYEYRLSLAPYGVEPQQAHAVENAAVNRLQAVARIRQCAMHDRGERIGEIALLERLAECDLLNVHWLRWNQSLAHGTGLTLPGGLNNL